MRGAKEMSLYLRERNYPNHTSTESKASSSEMLGISVVYASYSTFSKPLKFFLLFRKELI